jgi:hypothetical protein
MEWTASWCQEPVHVIEGNSLTFHVIAWNCLYILELCRVLNFWDFYRAKSTEGQWNTCLLIQLFNKDVQRYLIYITEDQCNTCLLIQLFNEDVQRSLIYITEDQWNTCLLIQLFNEDVQRFLIDTTEDQWNTCLLIHLFNEDAQGSLIYITTWTFFMQVAFFMPMNV